MCAAFGCWHKRRWPLFLVIGPSVLSVTSGLAEQLRETTFLFFYSYVFLLTLLAFTPEGIVVRFKFFEYVPK